ncbi:AAA family ATPase [Bradyrhizobium sp. SRL28]|uniref:ATP-dependent nuclease n=1 Tax=Bradyrhizobium sp. SRL28 TaxID=2836178 RepID=UPI001BDE0466|nr:AAA family ATPase [Bradyrhizobium sp. SRL28]MBT1511772.1 AAA family ATPase [Bradyrhizobium sp. SRL28]
MISEIQLKFGSGPGVASAPIPIVPVTIFVGPNNAGKSKVLSEIHSLAQNGITSLKDTVILQRISFTGLSPEKAATALDSFKATPNVGEILQSNTTMLQQKHFGRMAVNTSVIIPALTDPSSHLDEFCGWLLRFLILKLDGPNRVGLVNQQQAGDLQSTPLDRVLFKNKRKREEVRRIIHEAFGSYFVVDPTALGALRIRLSPRPPTDELEELNIHPAGIAFHAQATPIETTSDGVKAFTGIILEVIAGEHPILLIDEPEAFLHPSLAEKLGNELARAAVANDKRVFVSTHSPQFIMGCIQSGVPINIVRLTYRSNVPTARLLPSNEILELMRNPLLRSTGVLNGLFYEHVVITESDADRAFYQEINERLARHKSNWSIPNCLFLNSQNKQTIQTIMRPLRKLGIPAAGIVDIDLLKDSGSQWSGPLRGANLPAASQSSLAALRTSVKAAMDATGLDMKRDGGIFILQNDALEAGKSLLKQLAEYGLFVVPGGELESWLKHLGVTGHGPSWLINMFTRMGEDATSSTYEVPSDDDVWEFMLCVREWLTDSKRHGIPA